VQSLTETRCNDRALDMYRVCIRGNKSEILVIVVLILLLSGTKLATQWYPDS
jgi:hypothetical protein